MKTDRLLKYIVREAKVSSLSPPCLILFHGYGANEADLLSFAQELEGKLLIISVRAPIHLSQYGYAWYNININTKGEKSYNKNQAFESIDMICDLIDIIKKKYNINQRKLFILGFSQGAILSQVVALRQPEKCKYVLCLSGCVNYELVPDKSDKNYSHLDFYTSHGSFDQVIPVELARESPKLLNKLGITNIYQEFPVGHTISQDNFMNFKKWIEQRL